IKTRIRIIEARDKSQRNDVIRAAVNPRAAVFFDGQRPAQGVDDFARSNSSCWNFPEFFHSLAKRLRVAIATERETLDELFGECPARAVCQIYYFGLQVITRLKVRLGLILLIDALVVGAHATDSVAIEQEFRTSEAGKDRNSSFLNLAAEPFHKA